ncbi:VWA domain-containing protein [Kallipyga massiliensis]|uniref:vWA domain-containing protein n=1 Tax=Kallipyga massiliensis TaxID=1472764 RepID=UPI0026EBA8B0|nr:VWA domain-containing protein [Kallipyga massiliensis]
MNTNYNFNDYDLPPENVNMQHMPVAILCDVSGSMSGIPIQNVNLSVNRFASDVCKDPKASRLVDVAVLSFNEEAKVEQGFRPITELESVDFRAGGGTNITAGLDLAIKKIRERCRLYSENGIEIKMPYIILITDGYGGDVSEIAELVKQRTADKKMQLWILAVKGYDKETVAKLTEGKRVFELVDEAGYDFSEFFDFMAVSIKAVSTSSPDQRIHVDNPLKNEETNLKVPDLDDWLNS